MSNACKLLLTSLFSVLILSACGFKPRGSYLIDEQLNQIYVSSYDEFSPLTREVVRRLKLSHIEVLDQAREGVPTLQLGRENLTKRTLSLFSNGQTAEYEMSYRVESFLLVAEQESQPITVQLHRDFQDNPLAALAKQRESEQLYDELRVMAADQILRQLATVRFE
ncbi:LPS assembly lipoprotein LptE [Aliagarivorans taiwanensis]|uniref:LPS-assembly lipoprotein LptE n=1 Tax=Aliagarivorans taiwanensis TaxID=561966 RepID=UPI0003F82D3F|nr:LPS assembly lipoprotein LptE [Aliagarivorans taiwanensis]